MIYKTFEEIKKKYSVIYIDPPYKFKSDFRQDRNRPNIKFCNIYDGLMDIQNICNLPINNISEDNALLFLWITNRNLCYAKEIMDSWNFEYVTVAFVWVKTTINNNYAYNSSYWTLPSVELCLLGKKGKAFKNSSTVKQLVMERRTRHSEKPLEVRKRIEILTGKNKKKIEIFGRKTYPEWDTLGNQIFENPLKEYLTK
jgi:site-specific DNA-methyltransferase (adenine-specific)